MTVTRAVAVCLTLTILPAAPVRAQSRSAGIQGGVSMSRIGPVPAGQSISMRPGVIAGVYGHTQLFTAVGLQVEFVYAQKYSRSPDADLELDYLELPILAKLPLFRGIYILEGVSFAFPVRARLKPAASGGSLDVKSRMTSPDIGLVIGGGIPVAPTIAVEGRYDGGFRSIDQTPGAPVQRNRSFSALVRVRL